MLRDAINEIRLHPGRFVATLLAVAISVGFISAILVGVRSQENSVARSTELSISKADVVVSMEEKPGERFDQEDVTKAIRGVSGVTAAEPILVFPTSLTRGSSSAYFNIMRLPSEDFRWASLAEGNWPSGANEIVLSKEGAEKLEVKIGEEITIDGAEQGKNTRKVVGITNDAPTLYLSTAYVASFETQTAVQWVVKAQDPDSVAPAIQKAIDDLGQGSFKVQTTDAYRAAQLNQLTGSFEVFRNLLLGFAAISLIVGMIIIANTFTILVTQRRRQIGLLRAVGASTGQVAGRLLTESVLLGLIGSLIGVGLGIGVGAIAGYFTKSLYWGLVLPFGELAVAVAAGVLATVLSMIGPLLTATRVSPLEALQVVPSAARAKRLSIVRAVFCGLFLLLGGGLVFQAFSDTKHGLMWAAGGGAFLSLAILGAAPFYIPLLLRLFGRIFGFAGPTVKLAASNAARNPRRASATAVALMLAVGLVVTLQVGVSTMRTSTIEAINQRYPVDVSARATSGPLPSGVVEDLRNSSGVAKVVEVSSKQVDLGGEQLSVRNVNPGYAELGLSGGRNDAADGVVTVSLATARAMPSRIELPGAGEVEVRGSNKVEGNTAAVSESVFEKLSGTAEVREAWVKLTDRNSVSAINQVMNVLRPYMTQAATGDGVVMGGGATAAGIIEQVVNVLMVVLTALLGVAVAIALIGVGNTLGLSVLERQRESALLRALGMQRRSLRLMLLTEAMFLALAGIVLGVAAGSFFAWLGVVTSLGMMSESSRPDVVFSVNLPVTGGLILVCVAAAALASVLPGRRAANATPTEALAVD